MAYGARPSMNNHAHRNSFSAAYSGYFNAPPQNPYRAQTPQRSSTIECPWPVYALDWCRWPRSGTRGSGKIALGSFSDDMGNRLQVLQHGDDGELQKVAEVDATLPYPVTKVMWEPPRTDKSDANMIATCGDYLRVFSVGQGDGRSTGKLIQEVLLGNTKADFPAPLTSFDWNKLDPSIIVTASVDTTCTVWDLNTAQARTQLIAHDKEVYDVTFTANTTDVFASVGSDGSVRLFDLRALDHSTIIYESPASEKSPTMENMSPRTTTSSNNNSSSSPGVGTSAPLLRISACERDANLLATFMADSSTIQILDVRRPGAAILQLEAHAASVNALEWAPDSRSLIASCGDDSQVLVWDCNNADPQISGSGSGEGGGSGGGGGDLSRCREPVLAWTAGSEVNNISWNCDGDRLCAAYGRSVQVLKI